MSTIRQQLGCWFHERARTELVLRQPRLARGVGLSWLDLCNRNEKLTLDEETGTRICDWEDSSVLTVGRVFPAVSERLYAHCFSQWPIELNFDDTQATSGSPDASVMIAVGGAERLPLLRIVLASLRAQVGVAFEIIIVEQSVRAQLEGSLPSDVVYAHAPSPEPSKGFNKSHALNVAAEHAKADVLFVHDGDYVVPKGYLAETIRILGDRDACRPARLLFYLDRAATEHAVAHDSMIKIGIEKVVQNNPTPIAVTAHAYHRIGGHDESYFGWGGEDLEFLSRLRCSQRENGGTLPVVHLWHPAAPKKASGDRNRGHHQCVMAVPPQQRIERLVSGA